VSDAKDRRYGDSFPPPRAAIAARDAALRRASGLTRWIVALAIALTGLLSAVAAQAFHGHKRNGTARSAASQTTSREATPAPAAPQTDDPPLQPPAETPQPSQAAPPAVSGGS
jgi:hypothetical protein